MVELVLQTEKGLRIAARLAADGGPYLAPHLIDPEVMQAFRDLVREGDVPLPQANSALAAFVAFPIQRLPHDVLWTRMWELRGNLKAYDATYVVVAELAACPLVTCDGPMSRAPGNRAKVELF